MKVLITPRSFAKHSKTALNMLIDQGIEVVHNPYDRIMTKPEMLEYIFDVDGVIVGVDPLDKSVLEQAKKLKVISKYGVGTDNIDLDYVQSQNIQLEVTRGANTDAVADYAVSLMLACSRRVVQIDRKCRQMNWNKIVTRDMNQKVLGLIGFGDIGSCVAERVKGFNMKILAYDVQINEQDTESITFVDSLDDILLNADFISLHLPLNEHTKHMISYNQFEMMKETAVLINTARGGLINEEALSWALKSNQIWAAGIDVFEQEPPENDELISLDNIVLGSHCAASTEQAIDNMSIMASQNLLNSLLKQ